MSDETHLRRAIELAREHMAQGDGGPFGCVIARGEQVIAEGWNQVTSSNDPTAHAEVSAIRAACAKVGNFKLEGCVLYTSCEPCPMCLAACYWAGVDRIVFAAGRETAARGGFSDEFLYKEIPLPVDQRSIPTQQLLGEEGEGPFNEWLAKDDRVPY